MLSHRRVFFLYGSSYWQIIKNGGSSKNRTSVAWASSPWLVSRDEFCYSSGVQCSVLQDPPALLKGVWARHVFRPQRLCTGVLVSLLMRPHVSLCTSASCVTSLLSADPMDFISLNYLSLAVGDLLILHQRPLCPHPLEAVGEMFPFTCCSARKVG